MKIKRLMIIPILALCACNENIISSSQTQSSTNSSFESASSSSNPSESSSDSSSIITEKVQIDKIDSSKNLVLSATNDTNTAFSSWKIQYLEEGIQFDVIVEDKDIYTNNIYNIGYDDNIEFLINLKTDCSTWVVGGTYHFLLTPEGKYVFEKATSPNGLGSSQDLSLGVVYGENLVTSYEKLTFEKNNLDGYRASIKMNYDLLDTSYDEAYGNLSFCPAMRNAHTYLVNSSWSSYSNKGCKWGNASTFVSLNDDNTFGEKISRDLDVFYLGDSIFDSQHWSNYAYDHQDLSSLNIATSNATIEYYQTELDTYSECNIQNFVCYLGNNEIISQKKQATIETQIQELIAKINQLFKDSTIHFVSLVLSPENEPYFQAVESLNNYYKNIALLDENISYIACNEKMNDGNSYRSDLYLNNNLNYLGYNLLFEALQKQLSLSDNLLPDCFGNNEQYASSSTFKRIDEQIVEGIGDKDQYLVFRQAPTTSLTISMDISVKQTYNADSYPKFGLSLLGKEDTFFFYIDGSNNLSTQKVGYVVGKKHMNWQWALSVEQSVEINYSQGNYTNLKLSRQNGHIVMYVNNVQVFEIDDVFTTEELTSGSFLSFNSNVLIKNYSII